MDERSSNICSSEDEFDEEFVVKRPYSTSSNDDQRKRTNVITQKVSAILDRTNTSIRTSTMIVASLLNGIGCPTSSAVLSKSTVHRQRQRLRSKASKKIKDDFQTCKSVVHWDSKLLPDITGVDTDKVDRLPVLISSLVDGSIKLLGVPKLASGSGQAVAVLDLLKSWQCDASVIGM